jgi:hypothetical protein
LNKLRNNRVFLIVLLAEVQVKLHISDVVENCPDSLVSAIHGDVMHVYSMKGQRNRLDKHQGKHEVMQLEDITSFKHKIFFG